MGNIFQTLLDKYSELLEELSIGYPLSETKVNELMFYLHVLHYIGFSKSSDKDVLNIIAYYHG